MLSTRTRRRLSRLLLSLFVIMPGGFAMAGSIEEPEYTLVEKFGPVEIRRYEPTIQAVTRLKHNGQTSSGFQRLAGYIFGGNQTSESIAMTAPVQETLGVMEPEMAFTMPAAYAMEDLPAPQDGRVELREVPARYSAVISFSGWATSSKVTRYKRELMDELSEQGIDAVGASSLNQYNPPWTLPFLRRNEVMVDIEWVEGAEALALAP